MDNNFPARVRANIQKAIDDYNSKTCIKWIPRTNQANYARFINNENGLGCSLSKRAGRENFLIFEKCKEIHTIIKEMMHTLRFPQETLRYDRDLYIEKKGGSECSQLEEKKNAME